MSHATIDSNCAQTCRACADLCYSTALNHCLEMGGKHVEPEHFKLMLTCAKICETCACVEITGSPFCAQMCKVCAEVCEACASNCERIGEMDECVAACRRCADECRKMAA